MFTAEDPGSAWAARSPSRPGARTSSPTSKRPALGGSQKVLNFSKARRKRSCAVRSPRYRAADKRDGRHFSATTASSAWKQRRPVIRRLRVVGLRPGAPARLLQVGRWLTLFGGGNGADRFRYFVQAMRQTTDQHPAEPTSCTRGQEAAPAAWFPVRFRAGSAEAGHDHVRYREFACDCASCRSSGRRQDPLKPPPEVSDLDFSRRWSYRHRIPASISARPRGGLAEGRPSHRRTSGQQHAATKTQRRCSRPADPRRACFAPAH